MIPPSLPITLSITIIPWLHFALISLFFSPFSLSKSSYSHQFNPQPHHRITMPGKRNLSTSSSPHSLSSSPSSMAAAMGPLSTRNKKLRRLPHVFSKVLELPFDSDTDVSIEDRPDCLRFVAKEGYRVVLGSYVRAQVVEVHPGVTKVVIRRRENCYHPSIDELELNVWRFRLPATARPELAKAVYSGGQLVVTVPKNGWGENINRGDDICKSGFRDNMGNLILVQ